MAIQEKQLGQSRENSTSAVSVYSPGVGETAIIKSLVLCNQSGSAATFRVFLDDDGSTYDENTALYWDAPLPANSTLQIETYLPMNNNAGNLAYRSSVANAITITAGGAVIT
jgi:hypothetical protein